MLSLRSVMALLAVLALCVKVAESGTAAPDVCAATDVGKGFCLNCKTKAKCVTSGSPPVPTGNCTISGEACTTLVNVATCKPFASTTCSCAKASQCDVYDPDSVLICLSGGVTISKNCSSAGQTCVGGVCVAPATTVSTPSPAAVCASPTPDGFAVIKPACTTAAYCSDGEPLGTTDCAAGKYFDVNEMDCMPLPIVPCAGCGTGACPDKSDCSKWYICDGGVVLDEETCDGTTPDFDIYTNECVASGNCTLNANCTYGLTTTTTAPTQVTSSNSTAANSTAANSTATTVSTTTAANSRPTLCTATNVGLRYAYVGNCRKYWSCRLVSAGKYAYVESTCLGTLVFNTVTTTCDTLANVPGCVPPA